VAHNRLKHTDAQARYAAKKVGLRATKSRPRKNSLFDNHGGFQLINGRNIVVDGFRFELTADDVVERCTKPVMKEGEVYFPCYVS